MSFIKSLVVAMPSATPKPLLRDTIMSDAAPPAPSCAYPLDASSAEVTGAGFLPMQLTNGSQTAKLALVGAPGAARNGTAFPAGSTGGTGQKMDFSAGKKVIQWLPVLPTTVGGGPAGLVAYRLVFTLTSTAFSDVLEVALYVNADGTFSQTIWVNNVSVYTATPASHPTVVAMILDAVAGTVSVRFDDVPITLSANTYTPAQLIALIFATEYTNCPAGDAGKLVGGTLVTDHAQMTGVYTGGETDPCGTVI